MAEYYMNKGIAGGMLLALAGCAAPQGATPEFRLTAQSQQQLAPGSMLQRGRAQLGAGLDSMAIESFRTELRANPDSADAYNGLAVAYGRIGREDLAERYFEMALAKSPNDQRYQNNLARLLDQTEKPNIAVKSRGFDTQNSNGNDMSLVTELPEMPAIAQVLDTLPAPQDLMIQNADAPAKPVQALASPSPFLSRSGILSTQLAALPVRAAVHVHAVKAQAVPLRQAPEPEPSSPYPAVPFGDLPREVRAVGQRLERVSLGEVRLVTFAPKPVGLANKPEFATFGNRLYAWLPQAVATEQASQVMRPGDTPAMLAAIERAQVELALADVASPESAEFAYIFFDDDRASKT
jgi:hypothetical protein